MIAVLYMLTLAPSGMVKEVIPSEILNFFKRVSIIIAPILDVEKATDIRRANLLNNIIELYFANTNNTP